jgi:hypothetical protein
LHLDARPVELPQEGGSEGLDVAIERPLGWASPGTCPFVQLHDESAAAFLKPRLKLFMATSIPCWRTMAHGPFSLEQDRSDLAGDGGLVGEDADQLGSALDLAREPLELIIGSSCGWSGR